MIVRLQRPAARLDTNPPQVRLRHGPWLLTTRPDGPVDFIDPTPELERLMSGQSGYFVAEQTDDGWDIKGPANADLTALRAPV